MIEETLLKVTLKQPHTHAGQSLAPGAEIDVTPDEAQWLASHGVIEPAVTAPKQASDKAK
jgi:hypothetical protein